MEKNFYWIFRIDCLSLILHREYDDFHRLHVYLLTLPISLKPSCFGPINYFTCQTCHLVFTSAANLRRHLPVHASQRILFHCRLFQRSFSRMDNRNAHQKTFHKLQKWVLADIFLQMFYNNFSDKICILLSTLAVFVAWYFVLILFPDDYSKSAWGEGLYYWMTHFHWLGCFKVVVLKAKKPKKSMCTCAELSFQVAFPVCSNRSSVMEL